MFKLFKLKNKKSGITLVELVIVIAVTSIVLAELTTFIVYSTTQANRVTNQNQCYTGLMDLKKLITSEFYDYENKGYDEFWNETERKYILDEDHQYNKIESFKDDFWSSRATYWKEFSSSMEYGEKIISIDISDIDYLNNENPGNSENYVCKIEYKVKDGDEPRLFTFILNKH